MRYIIPIVLGFLTSNCSFTNYNQEIRRFNNAESPSEKSHARVEEPKETQVYILGTSHYESDFISRDSLYILLQKLLPSVILYEGNTKIVKRIQNKTYDRYIRLKKSFKNRPDIERPVVLKYLSKHPTCILKPYDWEDLHEHKRKYDIDKNASLVINKLVNLKSQNTLSSASSAIIDSFLNVNKALLKQESQATLEQINSNQMSALIKVRQSFIYDKLPSIPEAGSALQDLNDFIPIHMAYWEKRNMIMVDNILSQINEHPGEVMVVLNGFYHTYFLQEELEKRSRDFQFSIKSVF